MNLFLLLLPFLYMWADRFNGGGYGWERLGKDKGGPLPGHGGYYSTPILALVGYLAGGLPLLIAAGAWGFWRRGDGWKLAGHSAMTPDREDIPYALVRHSYFAFVMMVVGVVTPLNLGPFVVAGLVFALVATLLATRLTDDEIPNHQLEPLRGLTAGLLITLASLAVR